MNWIIIHTGFAKKVKLEDRIKKRGEVEGEVHSGKIHTATVKHWHGTINISQGKIDL